MISLQLVAILVVTVIFTSANRVSASQHSPADTFGTTTERPSQTHRPPEALEAGWWAYQHGDLTKALKFYQDASHALPNDATLWYDLGCLYALQKDFVNARTAFSRALTLKPTLAKAYDALGQLSEQEGDFVRANDSYTQADRLKPRTVKFLQHLLRTQLRLEAWEDARKTLGKLLDTSPSDGMAHYQLGVLQLRGNAPDLAAIEFQRAIEHLPNPVMAWNGLALAYARLGEMDKAKQAINQAIKLQPNQASTHTNLGIIAAREKRWDAARASWQKALEVDPQYEPAARNLEALDHPNSSTTP